MPSPEERAFSWVMRYVAEPLLEKYASDPAKLYDAVNQWVDVGQLLVDHFEEETGIPLRRLQRILAAIPQRLDDEKGFTYPNVVKWLDQNRPDLIRTVRSHPEGERWLETRVIKSIRRKVL